MKPLSTSQTRGGALLAVLWLSAALSAIAFSVALSVRGEVRRAETSVEGTKAEFLASGALARAFNYLMQGPGFMLPDGRPRFWTRGMPLLLFRFPEGEAAVEVIPESARLSVNRTPPEELQRLLSAMGAPELVARQVVSAIIDWRGSQEGGGSFDQLYLAQTPTFRAPHASLEQIEELLSVAGITPELFYGRYERMPDGQIVRRAGLRDCLSVYSSGGPLDINTTELETMIAVGASPAAAASIVMMRRAAPISEPQFQGVASMLGPAASRFALGGGNIYTLRATARLRQPDGSLSELRRSSAIVVQLNVGTSPDGTRVLRQYANAAGWPTHFDVWPQ